MENELVQKARQVVLSADNIGHSIHVRQDRKQVVQTTGGDIKASLAELLGDAAKPSHKEESMNTARLEEDTESPAGKTAQIERLCLGACREVLGDDIPVLDLKRADVRSAMEQAVSTVKENPKVAVDMFVRRVGMMAVSAVMHNDGKDPVDGGWTWARSEAELGAELNSTEEQ